MDKITKVLLALIAAGLWANAAAAQFGPMAVARIGSPDQQTANALVAIANGTCTNTVICGH